MRPLRLASVAALFALAACGQGGSTGGGYTNGGAGQPPGETVYQGAPTVIETPDHGPQMAWAMNDSYPPQGGGMDVLNWDWDVVEHESSQGTSWGSYIVTGTFDGEAFTLTEDPIPTSEVDPADYPNLEYTEPDFPEPSERLTSAELQEIVGDLMERFPELMVGGWVDEEHGVARIEAVLVTPEIEDYTAETHPEGTVVFTEMLQPVS